MLIILVLFRYFILHISSFLCFPQKDQAPFFFTCPSNKTLLRMRTIHPYCHCTHLSILICRYVHLVKAYLSIQWSVSLYILSNFSPRGLQLDSIGNEFDLIHVQESTKLPNPTPSYMYHVTKYRLYRSRGFVGLSRLHSVLKIADKQASKSHQQSRFNEHIACERTLVMTSCSTNLQQLHANQVN